MVYVLVFGGLRLALVGTAEWIKANRAFMARNGTMPGRFKRSTVPWMLEGGEVKARAIRDRFAPPGVLIRNHWDAVAAAGVDLVPMSPEFEVWLAADAQPWDGSEARTMGVRGLGQKAVKMSTLADRLAKRRA